MRNATHRRLRELRFWRRRVRKMWKKIMRRKKAAKKETNVMNKFSSLYKFLKKKDFFHKGSINSNGEAILKIPSNFSFIDNPEETILTLKEMFYYGYEKSVKTIQINHSKCKELGICASTVMDVILLEMRKNFQRVRKNISLSGRIPLKGKVRDMLEISGILKHLGFKSQEKSYIKKLELIKSTDIGFGASGLVATQITDYFIECLETQSFTLNKEGYPIMCEMIGEVINNCELHGGPFSKWYTLGHYHLYEEEEYGECHLVIFNFGNTIYDGLKLPTTSSEVKVMLEDLSSRQRGSILFNEETCWTLYALQEGFSRSLDDRKDPNRGSGTIKLINSFQEIGKTSDGKYASMSITSGRAHILFNDKYKMDYAEYNGKRRAIIAFNKENSLFKPPDPDNVKTLKENFPGTVISIKFYIDKKYINRLVEGR